MWTLQVVTSVYMTVKIRVSDFTINLSLGPFAITQQRARDVDFSVSVYTDDIVFMMPFKVENDPGIIMRPFGWRVWIIVLLVPPAYLLILGLSDFAFEGNNVRWWELTDFTVRHLFMHSVPKLPESTSYKRIFSITWIATQTIMAVVYAGFFYTAGLGYYRYYFRILRLQAY